MPPPKAAPATGPTVRKLKKGEMLFNEGDNSRAMYFLKTGMIRIFKKKGDSPIEIDTVHSGSVLGELAFLDGNPRSASGEALTDCELVEISGATFQAVLANIPDWLKILLKTVVGRLRTASTRIRQLEAASTAYVSEKDGKRSAQYVYLPPTDVLKLLSGLLLVASRNGTKEVSGIDIRMGLMQRYCNQIMGVPIAKMATLLDVLSQNDLVTMSQPTPGTDKTVLRDPAFIEELIGYLNEEYLLEPSKRHDVTLRGFLIMGLIAKHIGDYKIDERTKLTMVNIADVKNREVNALGKEPFRMEEFPELVKLGYATNINIKSADEAYSLINAAEFTKAFKLQRIVMAINAVNQQKR